MYARGPTRLAQPAAGLALLLLVTSPVRSQEPGSPPSWLDTFFAQETLSGDWGGARSLLLEHGLQLGLEYTFDVMANVSGGIRRKAEYLGNVDLFLSADLERLVGWSGAEIFLYGLGNHGGSPSGNVGDIQGVNNIEAVEAWKLYEAWIQQRFIDDRLSLLFGLYDLNSELEVIPAAGLFINSSFGIGADFAMSGVNGPSIFPTTSLGARITVQPLESFYVRAVVMDGVPGDPDDPTSTQVVLRSEDGLLVASEIGFINNPTRSVEFKPAIGHTGEPVPTPGGQMRCGYFGKYALGVWGYTTEFERIYQPDPGGPPEMQNGSTGFYVLGEQRVYCDKENRAHGLCVFARAGLADDRVQIIDAYAGGGLGYCGLIPGRDYDRMGLGVAAAHFGSAYRQAARQDGNDVTDWEIAVELTYVAQITPWMVFQPDLQYVINPGGDTDLDDALVLAGRFVLSF